MSLAYNKKLSSFDTFTISLNEHLNPKSKPFEMNAIDYNFIVGASIDRAENKERNLRETSPFITNLPNLKVFIPSNPLEMLKNFKPQTGDAKGSPMKIDSLSFELTIAITTNLKLDLVDSESKTNLITKRRKHDKEIHFVTF